MLTVRLETGNVDMACSLYRCDVRSNRRYMGYRNRGVKQAASPFHFNRQAGEQRHLRSRQLVGLGGFSGRRVVHWRVGYAIGRFIFLISTLGA
ncbi:hypothetical protein D3C80_1972400 [compost metagenome]